MASLLLFAAGSLVAIVLLGVGFYLGRMSYREDTAHASRIVSPSHPAVHAAPSVARRAARIMGKQGKREKPPAYTGLRGLSSVRDDTNPGSVKAISPSKKSRASLDGIPTE